MRLAKIGYIDDRFNAEKTQYEYNIDLWNYVKEREDIEEELGIDLVTLFKAFCEGSCGAIWMFVQNDYNEIYKKGLIKPFAINHFARKPNKKSFYLSVYDSLTYKNYIVDIKDYGKTWALSKEELENE